MLNVFISSVCQNQTRPCRQFYNMPRLPRFREQKCDLSYIDTNRIDSFTTCLGCCSD
nr:MAG TPA: hypothetical protein [Caudoviricetes sp.]